MICNSIKVTTIMMHTLNFTECKITDYCQIKLMSHNRSILICVNRFLLLFIFYISFFLRHTRIHLSRHELRIKQSIYMCFRLSYSSCFFSFLWTVLVYTSHKITFIWCHLFSIVHFTFFSSFFLPFFLSYFLSYVLFSVTSLSLFTRPFAHFRLTWNAKEGLWGWTPSGILLLVGKFFNKNQF
jgi:hypothetical protein